MEIKSTKAEDFKLIYDANYAIVMNIVMHIVYNKEIAEDLTQEAFERFYLKNMTFPSESDARYWLLRVAKNLALNSVRRNKREIQMVEKAKQDANASFSSVQEDMLIEREQEKEVRRAIAALPENLRLVIQLKEYSNLDYKTIGKILGISEVNVKVRVYRARKKLEELLVKEDSDVY